MIAIIGSGCWATALAKILLEDSGRRLAWWVRSDEVRDSLTATGRNPRHLPQLELDASRITVGSDLSAVVATADTLLLTVPSIYVADVLMQLSPETYAGKRVVSTVKGYVPHQKISVTQFLHHELHIAEKDLCVISGPSHAEEVAEEMPTFLTVASSCRPLADEVAQILRCRYIHPSVSDEVQTLEFCGLTKNVYAIAAGIAAGLGYGDNLISVLTAASAREFKTLLPDSPLTDRLLADLMATCFSHHSRNRALGEAVARGIAPDDYTLRCGMVAEGYHSARIMHSMSLPYPAPIAETVYRVLYKGTNAQKEMENLIDNVI